MPLCTITGSHIEKNRTYSYVYIYGTVQSKRKFTHARVKCRALAWRGVRVFRVLDKAFTREAHVCCNLFLLACITYKFINYYIIQVLYSSQNTNCLLSSTCEYYKSYTLLRRSNLLLNKF